MKTKFIIFGLLLIIIGFALGILSFFVEIGKPACIIMAFSYFLEGMYVLIIIQKRM